MANNPNDLLCPECDSPKTPAQATCGLMACDVVYAERMDPDQ